MWVLFAILNPLSDSFRNVFSKNASKNVHPLLISWFNNLIPLLIFTPTLFFIELKFSLEFFIALVVSGLINTAAAILYHRAISKGDISLVVPMLSFTPLFLLITSPLTIGEFPNTSGFIGIILIVIGSYLFNVKSFKEGIFTPLKSLLINKGTRYMLIISFIWSISANFDKIAIQSSSVLQYCFFINLFIFLLTSVFAFGNKNFTFHNIGKEKWNLLLVGLFTSFVYIFQFTALSLTLVAYVIALKRMSGIITIGLGHLFFKEKNIKDRFIGGIIMFAGVLFILL